MDATEQEVAALEVERLAMDPKTTAYAEKTFDLLDNLAVGPRTNGDLIQQTLACHVVLLTCLDALLRADIPASLLLALSRRMRAHEESVAQMMAVPPCEDAGAAAGLPRDHHRVPALSLPDEENDNE